MNINLEYYKIFYYVAKLNGITLAAKELCISQPAVSQAIKQLEQNLGAALFIRTPKGVTLTAEGALLYQYISAGYETIMLGEKKLEEMLDLEYGEVRIGASDMTLQFFLLPYLEQFHQQYPNIKVNVTNAPTPETITHLQGGRIDFGVVTMPFQADAGLQITNVRQIEDIFVAGSKFNQFKNQVLSFKQLETLPLICLEDKTSTRSYINAVMEQKGVVLKPEFELATSDMIVQFALRNLGIGCVVADFADKYLETGELFRLTFQEPIQKRDICVITQKNTVVSMAGKKLLELII